MSRRETELPEAQSSSSSRSNSARKACCVIQPSPSRRPDRTREVRAIPQEDADSPGGDVHDAQLAPRDEGDPPPVGRPESRSSSLQPSRRGMSPSWRDVRRNHRRERSGQPGAKNRAEERQPPRSGLNVPIPAFLRLLRQNPPKS